MKKFLFVLMIILFQFLFQNSILAQRIEILSDFDRASIGSLKQVSETMFKGQTMHWIKTDKIGNQYYWFYFQIINVKDKMLNFELDNLSGVYRGKLQEMYTNSTQPVVSYDNHNWERIKNVAYNKEEKAFTFSFHFKKDTAWIAYAHPYTYSHGNSYLQTLLRNEFVQIASKGVSSEGRGVNLIEITDRSSATSGKKNIFLTCLQHAGEDCGGFFIEGLIDYLVSDNPESKSIRNNYVFYIVPMMNPDGLFQGCTRYNANMEDLNSEWDDDLTDTLNLPVEMEVRLVKEWIAQFYRSGNKIDLSIDIHSHSQTYTTNTLYIKDKRLAGLATEVKKYWNLNSIVKDANIGSVNWFMRNQMNVPAATLELTQSHSGDNVYLNVEDHRSYGRDFLKALDAFMEHQEGHKQ